ncbi:hypothetical protein XcodCFBP4690_20945 [Xanthomonas codiaei]|uniref:Uncharacterized protein n=1 Tax=Xanthomonas codiaei TaxID=56463 RepID=A0A2S7C6U3_9XANT|nr:hypothetical protein XcodCFBP4690_20945 [Xanthomonas codiaei]
MVVSPRAFTPTPLRARPALAARALQGTRASGAQAVPSRPARKGALLRAAMDVAAVRLPSLHE